MVKVELPSLAAGAPVMYSEASTSPPFFFHLNSISAGKNPEAVHSIQATAWEGGCISCVGDGVTQERAGALILLESV